MSFFCPSKTFLMGEYAVLKGLPAILLTHPPYFRYENNGFIDPYQGSGGFGASGARFIFKLFKYAKKKNFLSPWEVLRQYKTENLTGSGADGVAQAVGGAVLIDFSHKKIIPLDFSGLLEETRIALVQTGQKIVTSVHLEDLRHRCVLDNYFYRGSVFETTVKQAYDAIKAADGVRFLNAVRLYAEALQQRHLTSVLTQQYIKKMQRLSCVWLAKGCGALGADVILAIVSKDARAFFLKWAQKENLRVIYFGRQWARGAFKA